MKTKDELQPIIREIASDASPIGMDPVYVHALILDKLTQIERRLDALEKSREQSANANEQAKRQTV